MYTILKKRHEDSNFFAISENKIETLALSDTYDQFGQEVSPSDAGDYCIIETEEAIKRINNFCIEEEVTRKNEVLVFKIGEIVAAHDMGDVYDFCLENEEGLEFYKSSVEGFNYWDGHNNRSIIVDSEINSEYCEYEVVKGNLADEINESIDNMEFESEGSGLIKYLSERYEIIESQFANAWVKYEITKI